MATRPQATTQTRLLGVSDNCVAVSLLGEAPTSVAVSSEVARDLRCDTVGDCFAAVTYAAGRVPLW